MPSVGYATLQIIPSVRGIGDDLRRQLVGPAGDAGDRAGEQAGSGFGEKFKKGVAAGGAAAGAVLVAATVSAVEKERMGDKLSAQLGLSGKGAKRAGDVAGKLYSGAVVDSFEDGAAAVRAVMGSGLIPEKSTTKSIQAITTKVADLASTFDQDLTGTANAAAQMIRTGLAKDGTQALDLLTKGFQSSANKADDLVDTVSEYGTQFRKAGLDGATSIGLLNQAVKAGARDADVAADAIKEFSIRAIDGSDSTQTGFEALGLSATDMADKFAKGGKSANGVLDLTLDKLRNVKDPVKQSQIAVKLFGTQAEDLGASLLAMDPSSAADDLGKVGGAAKKVGDTIRGNTSTELKIFQRQLMGALGDTVTTVVLPALRGLLDAAKWVGDAFSATVGWFKEWGIWLVPLAILIGGVTLALNAQAIATGLVTAVFSVYRAAILIGTAVTTGFAGAQAFLNAVMAANPIILVVTALLALGAALFIAYQKSETFRAIVQAAWQGIQAAAMVAWNTVLKPVLNGIVTAALAVGQAAVWLWQTVLSPVFSAIGLAARILLAVVVTAVLTPIVLAFKLVAAVATWLWQSVLSPVFQGIAALATWFWTTVVQPVFGFVVGAFRGIGRIAMWLWHTVLAPAFSGIGSLISQWWTGVKVIFSAVRGFITGPLAGAFTTLWHKVIQPVWNGIKTAISVAWDTGIKPVFSAIKKGVGLVKDAFSLAAEGIGKVWSGIKKATKAPVQFVVDTVYNNGVRKVWNTVAGFLSLDKLDEVKFAGGGRTRGGVPGKDSIPALMMADEFVVKRSSARSVGFATLDYINRTGTLPPQAPVQRFAKGGIVGTAADYIAHPGKAWTKATGWIREKVKQIGASKWAQALAKIPGKMIGGLKDKIVDEVGSLFTRTSASLTRLRDAGKGVTRWTPVVLQALKMVGQPASLLGTVLRRMAQESGGNPRAINNWDINAKNGDPSRGLMQTIGATFNAYAGKLRGRGIYDPLANIYASMRYALSRYGSLSRAYNRPGGYASGGRPRAGELAWVGERGPELLRFRGGEEVYDNRTSLRMAAGLVGLRGFAKGSTSAKVAARARARARGEVPGDLSGFTKSLTGSASDISKAAAALAKDLKAAGGAGRALATQTGKVSAKLQSFAKQRDSVDSKLEAAKTAASDQKKSAADFFGLGSQTSVTSLGDLITGLRGKQAQASTFQGQIAKLSKRGLSQDLIRQLVEQGPDGALIGMVSGASKSQLGELNKLAKSGAKLSTSYGNTMADAMFDAGSQAGKGFLTGLKAQEKELQKAMDKLGGQLVSAIKKRLKIKSPSRVTAALGAQTGQGMAVGLDATAATVAAAAARVADAAVPAPAPAAVGSLAAAPAGLAPGARLRLVVGGREFDAYLEEVADARVDAGFTRARRLVESRS
ncbi:phage tail tape measure protein [Streptomyces sp. NEAU-Y11]|uniref:phage tail tape measure protein n=1 Tax=Streptomyces cucumeris TaxID=2962890 RepID=UPI0020C8785C|nr:phage tail tape measure protein [Streptomyces sp. NEAU-Y11]MCP9205496.1 phage tail tape measure protein [Streptomyces sp. NEAU-Y11]